MSGWSDEMVRLVGRSAMVVVKLLTMSTMRVSILMQPEWLARPSRKRIFHVFASC